MVLNFDRQLPDTNKWKLLAPVLRTTTPTIASTKMTTKTKTKTKTTLGKREMFLLEPSSSLMLLLFERSAEVSSQGLDKVRKAAAANRLLLTAAAACGSYSKERATSGRGVARHSMKLLLTIHLSSLSASVNYALHC